MYVPNIYKPTSSLPSEPVSISETPVVSHRSGPCEKALNTRTAAASPLLIPQTVIPPTNVEPRTRPAQTVLRLRWIPRARMQIDAITSAQGPVTFPTEIT